MEGKFAMFKNRKIVMPSEEEEAAINRGIAAAPDTYEVSREEIQEMRPLTGPANQPAARCVPISSEPSVISISNDCGVA